MLLSRNVQAKHKIHSTISAVQSYKSQLYSRLIISCFAESSVIRSVAELKRSVLNLNTNQSNIKGSFTNIALEGVLSIICKYGGWGHKTGIKLYIYHPINLHGVEIRFLNFEHLNPMGELWQRLT